jgi:hypothetical protein
VEIGVQFNQIRSNQSSELDNTIARETHLSLHLVQEEKEIHACWIKGVIERDEHPFPVTDSMFREMPCMVHVVAVTAKSYKVVDFIWAVIRNRPDMVNIQRDDVMAYRAGALVASFHENLLPEVD